MARGERPRRQGLARQGQHARLAIRHGDDHCDQVGRDIEMGLRLCHVMYTHGHSLTASRAKGDVKTLTFETISKILGS